MIYTCHSLTQSLYIHWPFCPYKCHFCPFVALAGHDQFMERYHQALLKEIEQFAASVPHRLQLKTIYFGGGTPSTYPNELLLDMFGILKKRFDISDETEITLEVNPGTVNAGQLAVWKQVGINRLSIGVQSLNDAVLKDLNRHQSAADVFALIEEAHPLINNLSVDLIVGLPGINAQEWKALIQTMVTLPIQHISVYFLTVHEDTALYFRVQKKQVTVQPDDAMVDLYLWTVAQLAQHGFAQYEVSNFARPGFHSRHNTVYWQRKPYKAFGLGACSFDGTTRFQHEKNLMKYLNNVEQGISITTFHETLTPHQVYIEQVMLGLRQAVGIDLRMTLAPLSEQEQVRICQRIEHLKTDELVVERDGRIILTPKGLSVENQVALHLAQS